MFTKMINMFDLTDFYFSSRNHSGSGIMLKPWNAINYSNTYYTLNIELSKVIILHVATICLYNRLGNLMFQQYAMGK